MRLVLLVTAVLLLTCRSSLASFTEAEGPARRGEYPAAYDACKAEAEKGDAECQNLVGVLFQKGLGVPNNLKEAMRLFALAASQKLSAAQINLGLTQLNGLGIPPSEKEAARWFELASAQGDPVAEYHLAVLLLKGREIEKNPEKAVGLLRDGADRGFAPAQLMLALALDYLPKDQAELLRLNFFTGRESPMRWSRKSVRTSNCAPRIWSVLACLARRLNAERVSNSASRKSTKRNVTRPWADISSTFLFKTCAWLSGCSASRPASPSSQ